MSNIEVSGKVTMLGQLQSGEGKNGTWVRQDLIIETDDQFPKKLCLSCWGDKAAEAKSFATGEKIKASVNLESREFNGRWYTDVRVWKFDKIGTSSSPAVQSAQQASPFEDFATQDSGGDLPF
jgi:hypothetical protein